MAYKITITGLNINNEIITLNYPVESKEIKITNIRLIKLDLKELQLCQSLVKLIIHNNLLKNIDLSSLHGLKTLQEVDLSENQLLNLNLQSLSKCENLKILRLNSNSFQRLDLRPLQECKNLEELYLQDNQLEELLARDLHTITRLNISDNNLSELDLIALNLGLKLEELNLRNNQLLKLDLSKLDICTNLSELDLSQNQLINVTLCHNSSLKNLYLNRNELVVLDLSAFKYCPSLELIDLSENHFEILELSALSYCRSLKYLALWGNTLIELSIDSLKECIELEELYLDNNRLQSIDLASLSDLKSLHTLDLHDNLLDSINLEPLATCENLQAISLWNNQLQEINLNPLNSCKKLEEINLMRNQLQKIILDESHNLKYLSIKNNFLISIDLEFAYKNNYLLELNLSGNRLRTVDLTPLSHCVNLKKLDLTGNDLQEIDLGPLKEINTLEELYFSENQLTFIDLIEVPESNNLKVLDISGNNFNVIDLNSLNSYKHLEYLYISDNNIKEVNIGSLALCKALKGLYLNKNQLSTIDISPLQSTENLVELDLSYNNLETIDLSFLGSLKSLRKINLNINKIKILDLTNILKLKNLQLLKLEGNNLVDSNKNILKCYVSDNTHFFSEESIDQGIIIELFDTWPELRHLWLNTLYIQPLIAFVKLLRNDFQLEFYVPFKKTEVTQSLEELKSIVDKEPNISNKNFYTYLLSGQEKIIVYSKTPSIRSIKTSFNEKKLSFLEQYINKDILLIIVSIFVALFLMNTQLKKTFLTEPIGNLTYVFYLTTQLIIGIGLPVIIINIFKTNTIKNNYKMRKKNLFKERFTFAYKLEIQDLGVILGIISTIIFISIFFTKILLIDEKTIPQSWNTVLLITIAWNFLISTVRLISPISFVLSPFINQIDNIIFYNDIGMLIRILILFEILNIINKKVFGIKKVISNASTRISSSFIYTEVLKSLVLVLIGIIFFLSLFIYGLNPLNLLGVNSFKIGIVIGCIIYLIFDDAFYSSFVQSSAFILGLILDIELIVSIYHLMISNPFIIQSPLSSPFSNELLIIIFVCLLVWLFYYGGIPLKTMLFNYSFLSYLFKSNENYLFVWEKDNRSYLHKVFFSENNSLKASILGINYNKDQFLFTMITLGLVYIIIPISIILLLVLSISNILLIL